MEAFITSYQRIKNGYELKVLVPKLSNEAINQITFDYHIPVEIFIDDGVHNTNDQRKKIMAVIGDICEYTGDEREELRYYLTFNFCKEKGYDFFTLSFKDKGLIKRCPMQVAGEFIEWLIEYCYTNEIPLSYDTIQDTKEVAAHMYYMTMQRKCCVCGQRADIHHVDKVGMGNDRKTINHVGRKAMPLCRAHHNEAHNIGQQTFENKYHVQPVVLTDEMVRELKL